MADLETQRKRNWVWNSSAMASMGVITSAKVLIKLIKMPK